MKYATASGFRTALETRLLSFAQQRGVPLVRLRKLVVFDRLLARLLVVAQDRWVLKGALALEFRLGGHTRTTKDMDIARQDSEEAATADFLAAQVVDLGDYFTFAIQRTDQLDAAPEVAAVRYHVRAELAGRPFEDAIVDVGFGDPLVSAPEQLPVPDLLSFAGLSPVEVPVLPLEQHVAEKVHAYTRTYSQGQTSSRVKDLVDLVLIVSHASMEVGLLSRALAATFQRRGTHRLPPRLPPPPASWRPAYRRLAAEVGIDADVAAGLVLVAGFLDPILAGTVPDYARWDPSRGTW